MSKLLLALALFCCVSLAQAGVAIEHWQTPNGTRVIFVGLHDLPILDVRVDFRAGSMFDPPGKSGLAALTHALLDLGADDLDEAAISNRLADVGAHLGGDWDNDRAGLRLRTLTQPEKKEAALSVLEKVLRAPHFDTAVFERERAHRIAELKDALTRPGTLARRAFWSALYPEHPYGRLSTPESLATLTTEDLRTFWQHHYSATNAIITLVGDLSRAEAENLAARLSAALPADDATPLALPEAPRLEATRTVRIPHPAQQAHISIGLPAIERGNPDYFPLLIGNYTLGGGGFVSRLMSEVREKRGLAYSVYSTFSPLAQAGPFQIGMQTQKEQTDEALNVTRDVLTEFLEKGPTPTELQAAQDHLAGGFPLNLDSNAKILANVSTIAFYGLPLDYLETWQAKIRAVTTEDVRRAFARHIQMEKLVTVIVAAP